MKAQTNETIGNYKLVDMKLEYDVIESKQLVEEVKGKFNLGRSLGYDHTTLLKVLLWSKDGMMQSIDINIPRRSIKAVVLLFTKKDAGGSEEFVFPNLTHVNVAVEGNPSDIYSQGLAKRDMYSEAVRFFSNNECKKNLGTNCVSRRKYYTDKFACVIDFRTIDDDTVSGRGRKPVRTQAGILLQIEKETTATNLTCHVFVVADGLINIMGTRKKMNTLSHMIIVGMTACGKTHYLLDMLEQEYKGHFDYILIVCPTLGDRDVFELACAHDEVEKILQDIVHFAKNTNSLIVLDDCAACKD